MDLQTRNELILNHVNKVGAIASNLAFTSNSDIEDLKSAGYEGLVRAADKFDKNGGVKFWTFAYKNILWRMNEQLGFDTGKRDNLNRKPNPREFEDVGDIPVTEKKTNIDLKRAILSLDKDLRDIILLYYYGGFADGEIAKMFGRSRECICKKKRRALRRLSEIL